jgi:very-short-patch-repair endonuclease
MNGEPRLTPRDFARQLRQKSTDAEKRLWSLLRDRKLRGFKFRRQHPVAPYVLDFYCAELSLAVELDGGGHLEPEQRLHDQARTAFLGQRGILVKRVTNHEVLVQTEALMDHLWILLTERAGIKRIEDAQKLE